MEGPSSPEASYRRALARVVLRLSALIVFTCAAGFAFLAWQRPTATAFILLGSFVAFLPVSALAMIVLGRGHVGLSIRLYLGAGLVPCTAFALLMSSEAFWVALLGYLLFWRVAALCESARCALQYGLCCCGLFWLSLFARNQVLASSVLPSSPTTLALGYVVPALVVVLYVATDRVVMSHLRSNLERIEEAKRHEGIALLAGGVAHDFNNLLTGVIGQTSLALSLLPAETSVRQPLERALEAADLATELVAQLLAYAGKGATRLVPLDLVKVTEQCLKVAAAIDGTRSGVRFVAPSSARWVEGDRSQLSQVVLNLVINAREAGGQVTVELYEQRVSTPRDLELHRHLAVGDYVVLEVRDDGPGMSAEVRRRLFEPFFSTKGTGSRGLGLAVTAGIVDGHGGGVELESEPGQGSTFRIFLPRAQPPQEVRVTASTRPPATLGGTFLLIDDEPAVRDLLVDILRTVGAEPVVASNGLEGIERFSEQPARFDAVILDVNMPGLDGLATLLRLREVAVNVPVLLSSARRTVAIDELLREGLIAGFLGKPYRPEQLVEALRPWVASQPGGISLSRLRAAESLPVSV